MYFKNFIALAVAGLLVGGCNTSRDEDSASGDKTRFPRELTSFTPYAGNPVFGGTNAETWDQKIRERGFIMKEDSTWYLWYTGYTKTGEDKTKYLGLAVSNDGLHWERYQDKPVYTEHWVEDMFVHKENGTYYMFAEGKDDIAHLLTSTDRVHWTETGPLDIRLKNGEPLPPGPFGTPAVWKEGDVWYLFYERNDSGIWLATSKDMKVWTNTEDEPVIAAGPEPYDKYAVAVNQIIQHNGLYYAYYHASAYEDWREWTMNIAVSEDLVRWEKYTGNPIMGNNLSSGMTVKTGEGFRFYTMHPEVHAFLPDTLLQR